MSVAIDDFGTGHSGLMQIVGLNLISSRSTISLIDTISRINRSENAGAASSPWRLRFGCARWLEGVETWEEAFFFALPVSIAVKVGFGAKPWSAPEASRVLTRAIR